MWLLQIVPGATSLLQSSVQVDGLTNVQAGITTTFTILARDAFGNSVLGGDDIKVGDRSCGFVVWMVCPFRLLSRKSGWFLSTVV